MSEPTVEVPLDAVCVLIERVSLHGGTPEFAAYMAMPPAVHTRLGERQDERTQKLILAGEARLAHERGEAHNENICITCVMARLAMTDLCLSALVWCTGHSPFAALWAADGMVAIQWWRNLNRRGPGGL